MLPDSPTSRACGRRIRGGVYAETRLSEDGLPIEYLLIDLPIPVDLSELGLASVSVQLTEMCAGLWWHDLPDPPGMADSSLPGGQMLRRIEGGTLYRGYPQPQGVVPSYRHGVFLSLPIHNLVVILGGDATERNYQAACNSRLPVYLEEE